MKITLLILEGNNRLNLGGKNRIVYSPKRDFQLIIGTNGGGKTTMLNELSLLPPDGKDYDKGGMKEIHAEHNGNFYIARSTFDGSPKHEFFKNGVNLNKGFTLTVQRELIKNETGMTPELHELLTGQIRFTAMNASQRRHWITRFCPVDLAYANQMYQKAKAKLSQTNGALKHINSRIAQETNRLLEMTDIEDIEKRILVIRTMLDNLTSVSNGERIDTYNVFLNIKRNIRQVEIASRQVIRNRMDKPPTLNGIYTYNDAVERINEFNNQIAAGNATLKALTDEYSQYSSLRDMVMEGNPESIEFIQSKLTDATTRLSVIHSNSHYVKRYDDCELLLRSTQGFMASVQSLLHDVNTIEHFMSPIEAEEVFHNLTEAKERLSTISNRLHKLEERKEHIHDTEDNTCPSCTYVWKPGVSEHELEELEGRIVKGYELQKEAIAKVNDLTKKKESAEFVLRYFQQFRTLFDNHGHLSDDIDAVKWSDLNNRAGEVILLIENLIQSIKLSKEEGVLERQVQQYQDAIEHAKIIQRAQSMHQSERVHSLENRIHEVTQLIADLKHNVKITSAFLNHVDHESKQVDTIVNMWNDIIKGIRDYVVGEVEDSIQQDITLNQGALGQLQRKLNEKNLVESIVATLQADKEQLMVVEAATKLLLKELSPTEGLIAEQLYGSITNIVKKINAVVARIWTYALVVQPCATENDDLDYKFPMMVEHAGVVRSDISKGSSSMKDIINYAFTELAYDFENLDNFPLFLDEFGHRFDPEHLNRAMNYIQNKAEIGEYSQIFMISHFENYYGGFPSSDITLLHDGNVKFTAEHNQCIEIS